jgi:hypothetical protein
MTTDNQDPNVTLTLPLSVVNTALAGLAELPAKLSLAAIASIRDQASRALAAAAPDAANDESQAPDAA